MKNKTFLVTGGTGFIGSNIAKLLVKKNLNVKIFDNNSRGSINKIKNLKKKISLKKTALPKGSAKIRVPDIGKIRKLGFKPKFNLDRGLKKILH